jgi:iron complex outermembrane receptor protein
MSKGGFACRLAAIFAVGLLLSGRAWSQAQEAKLEEIIVTAQHRSENLQDVPISIIAKNGEELQARQITTAEDLMLVVPDLRVASAYESVSQNFSIRGIGPANQYNFNVMDPVGIYMDEVYQAFQPAPGVQLFDLDRVEVLKGPQGTLYGRNTTGGAINLHTRDPALDGDYHGYLQAGGGNLNGATFQGAADVTFIDHVLGVRLAFSHDSHSGAIDNLYAGGPKSFGDTNTNQGRVSVRFVPSDTFDATLKLYLNNNDGSPPPAIGYGICASTGCPATPLLPPEQPLGTYNALGYSRVASGLTDRQAEINFPFMDHTSSTQGGLTLNWTTGPFKITSITSGGVADTSINSDCDYTPQSICAVIYNFTGNQFTQDLRALYASGPLSVTGGAEYTEDTFNHSGRVSEFTFNALNTFQQKRDSYGIYFDGTYSLTDALKLTLGVRDTQDRTRIIGDTTAVLTSMFGPQLVVGGVPFYTVPPQPVVTQKSNGPTGRLVLTYNLSSDNMVYVSVSHGYRTGAFNGQQFVSPADLSYVGPEKDNNYEIGAKFSLLDRRIRGSFALFDTQMKGQQVLSSINIAPSNGQPGLSYSGIVGLDGYSRGFELEAEALVVPTLRATLALTALQTRYDEGPNQIVSGDAVGGNKFPFAPNWAVQGGLDWTAWEKNDRSFTLSANVSYTGHYFYDPENGSTAVLPLYHDGSQPYTLVDGRAKYQVGRIAFSLWAKNIFDRVYYSSATNSEASFGSDAMIRGVPRTFGGNVEVKF